MKILCLLFLSLTVLAEPESLDLSRGRFIAGGSASGAILWDKNGNTGTRFDIRPSLGYLPLDRFSVETSLKLLIDPVEGAETNIWGFGVAFYYYFNAHKIFDGYVPGIQPFAPQHGVFTGFYVVFQGEERPTWIALPAVGDFGDGRSVGAPFHGRPGKKFIMKVFAQDL